MSALASMTGLTGWLELNKQGDSSGRLVTKVLFLGYCTVSLFGGETSCFDSLLTDYLIYRSENFLCHFRITQYEATRM